MAKQGEVFTHKDCELLSFDSKAVSTARILMLARRMTANLVSGYLDEREIIEHISSKITVSDIYTLRPLRAPNNTVISAFFALLQDSQHFILPTPFVYNLVIKTTAKMLAWRLLSNALRDATNTIIHLHSRSSAYLELAVVRRKQFFIDLFDSIPTMQKFRLIYPHLVRCVNSLRGLENTGDGWHAYFRV